MFQLIKGVSIPDISGLKEEYQIYENWVYASISAENIPIILMSFLNKMKEEPILRLYSFVYELFH